MVQWRLTIHGDSRESYWAKKYPEDFEAYEEFWRAHIVPLTFRIAGDQNFKYVRPTQRPDFLQLADSNYATFYHLTAAHAWQDRLLNYRYQRDCPMPNPTESLYYFFSHARSMLDALLSFAASVNKVLISFDRPEAFDLGQPPGKNVLTEASRVPGTQVPRGHRKDKLWLGGCFGGPSLMEVKRLFKIVGDYRNFLVHERPVFVLGGFIPKQEMLEERSGLAELCFAAANPGILERDYELTKDRLTTLTSDMRRAVIPVWKVAKAKLDELGNDYKSEQVRIQGGDGQLNSEMVRKHLSASRATQRSAERTRSSYKP